MDITKCEYGVLTLSERPLGRNAVTGRFMKGHVPANKGRKWDEYMTAESKKRVAVGWRNLAPCNKGKGELVKLLGSLLQVSGIYSQASPERQNLQESGAITSISVAANQK